MNNSVKSVIAIILLAVVINVVLLSVNMNPIVPTGGQPDDPLEAWSESSVIIWQYNSTPFYASRNMSTNMVIELTSNLTRIEQNVLGNMTTGLLYLIECQHNASLSLTATQIVTQQYSGQLTYYTDTGSSSVTDCPVATIGNFTFPSGTSETTILTLATPTSIMKLHNLYIDLSVLTQNCTLRVYINFTGSYVEMTSMTVTVAAGSYGLALKDMMINSAWKLTVQSAVAEGATRYLYYQYFSETY